MPTNEITGRVMHPVDVDTEVIVDLDGLKRAFPEDPNHELDLYADYNDIGFPYDIRRGTIEKGKYRHDLGEHEYEVAIRVDPCSPLFTEEEKAYGYKTIKVLQHNLVRTN